MTNRDAALLRLFRSIFVSRQWGRVGAAVGMLLMALLFVALLRARPEDFLALSMVDTIGTFIVNCAMGYFLGRYLGRLKGGKEATKAQKELFKLLDEDLEARVRLTQMWNYDEHREHAVAQELLADYEWKVEYRQKYSLI